MLWAPLLAGIVGAATQPPPLYTPVGAVFNGATYLSRGAQYTGVVDAPEFALAFAIKPVSVATEQNIIAGASSNARYIVGMNIGGGLYLFSRNPAGATVIGFETTTLLAVGAWNTVLLSANSTDDTSIRYYINDAAATIANLTFVESATINFAVANNTVGRYATAASGWTTAELSDVWMRFGTGVWVDFSVESNRRKFFSAGGALVNKGTDGSIPFGVAPQLFLSGAIGGWHTNKGSGGGLIVAAGALSASSSPPAGV